MVKFSIPCYEQIMQPGEMVQWVMVFATKPNSPSSFFGSTQWMERSNHLTSSHRHVHTVYAHVHTCIPALHKQIRMCNKNERYLI